MSREQELIDKIVSLKKGNKEMMIYRYSHSLWTAEIGNLSNCVSLGEASGEFSGKGKSMLDALKDLAKRMS